MSCHRNHETQETALNYREKRANKRGKRNFLEIEMDDATVHCAFFQYRYVILNSALSGKQILYLRIRETNERERKKVRERERTRFFQKLYRVQRS